MHARIPRLAGHTAVTRSAVIPAGARASSSKATPKAAPPEVVFSGIQPTGTPHLGNYLGLFLPFLELQKTTPATTPVYLTVVGLHAITLPQDPVQLVQDRRNMLASLLACGVDPERTTLFLQEDVREHSELAWFLNTIAPVGRLQRMTTWKSRLATARNANSEDEVSEEDLRLGLLSYPVLQAADIMLYKSTIVPVGEDQTQHLELARDIAQGFNRQFGDVFPIPETRVVPQKRVLSLRDPAQKMSKSAPNPLSRISLTDSPKDIAAKIKGAVTDSIREVTYEPDTRAGVANLLTIWAAFDEHKRTPEQLAAAAQADGWGAGKLKAAVSEVVAAHLAPVQEEYKRIIADEGYIRDVAAKGANKAREQAAKTMAEVRAAVGLGGI
ncbi:Tryptophan--tRNA ligase, mitochondrial [Vanrija pseudolonga]|uniref:tryptophan--tRNA ligase n=1 Tax=Vanrija pseudolonga TaxID=143232 RepID=A0AAF0Y538_9TREE|nr:Tryptophan--tRNA ligase, mitochondrial [Vanrija pseudolonga]